MCLNQAVNGVSFQIWQRYLYWCNDHHVQLLWVCCCQVLHNLGTVCEKQKDLDRALYFYKEAVSRQNRVITPAQKLQVGGGVRPQFGHCIIGVRPQFRNCILGVRPQFSNCILGVRPQFSSCILGVTPQFSNCILGGRPQCRNCILGVRPQFSSCILGVRPQLSNESSLITIRLVARPLLWLSCTLVYM